MYRLYISGGILRTDIYKVNKTDETAMNMFLIMHDLWLFVGLQFVRKP